MHRGRFIVLEGGEGAGKSTQARRVGEWLRHRGSAPCETREPGGTPVGEGVRDLLKRGAPGSLPAEAELLLLFAARSAHLRDRIRPALESGQDVVCDRYVDASYAYQGAGRGLPTAWIDALCDWICGDTEPDLVLLLDLPPEVGRARAMGRGELDRFEQEDAHFAHLVRDAYLARAATQPQRYAVIDADADEDTVWSRIAAVLEARL